MPNIFAGVEPPAWLVERSLAYKPGTAGQSIGLLLGGAMNALKRDESAPVDAPWLSSRKGFWQGMAEGRMNMADPMWRVKKAQIEAQMEQGRANMAYNASMAEIAKANADIKAKEFTMNADEFKRETDSYSKALPGLTEWRKMTPEQRYKAPLPDTFGSQRAWQELQQLTAIDERYMASKEISERRKERFSYLNDSNKMYNTRRQKLDPTTAATVDSVPFNEDGSIPKEKWDALREAEIATEKLRGPNLSIAARQQNAAEVQSAEQNVKTKKEELKAYRESMIAGLGELAFGEIGTGKKDVEDEKYKSTLRRAYEHISRDMALQKEVETAESKLNQTIKGTTATREPGQSVVPKTTIATAPSVSAKARNDAEAATAISELNKRIQSGKYTQAQIEEMKRRTEDFIGSKLITAPKNSPAIPMILP